MYRTKMSTKPKFLSDIEKKIRRSLSTKDIGSKKNVKRIDVFRDAFEFLIKNIQTFGPILAKIKGEYEEYIVQLKEHMKYLQVTNDQLFIEMRKFQEEISSEEDEPKQREYTDNLIERIRIKREKEKQKRQLKYEMHEQEINGFKDDISNVLRNVETLKGEINEKDKKYDRLVEEFKDVQARFAAYKAIKDEV